MINNRFQKKVQQNSISSTKLGVDITNVTTDLFSSIAEEVARRCNVKDRNSTTQLRKLYDELVMWHDKVFSARTPQDRESIFIKNAPYIQMMRAKVAYAEGRKLVDSTFREFFDQIIRDIKNVETLKNARLFMEAFMGFRKLLEK